MIMSYDNDNVRLNNLNKVYFCNIKDYYSFLEKLYSEKCTINGDIISKKYKIYNLCDYSFNNKKIQNTKLFKDYILLKIINIKNNIKDDISSNLYNVFEKLKEEIDIYDNVILDNFDYLLYKLLIDNNVIDNDISIEKMINYIVSNTKEEYFIINDSSLFNINKYENLIIFDINKNFELIEYNLFSYNDNFKNINFELLIDNFYRYWPLPINKDILLSDINNLFFTIISKKNISTYYDNYAILAKLISYFYDIKINIIYKGKNNAIKSFITSALNI